MNRITKALLAVMLIVAGSGFAAIEGAAQTKVARPRPGPAGSWRLIGQVTASFKSDHDTIIVAGPFDNFRRIMFKVTDAPINIQRMVVTYDNGEPDEIAVRARIPKNGQSRAIDLKGIGKRSIRKIEFWYDTKGLLDGRAEVTVFGMH